MSWKEIIKKCLNVASAPIRRNANFFVFMYLLGMISSIVTTPAKGDFIRQPVPGTLCRPLCCVCRCRHLPQEGALWACVPYYTLYYIVTAAADTYCYVNFGSTLNPSMLMLVGETNSSEASSFLSALISAEVTLQQCRLDSAPGTHPDSHRPLPQATHQILRLPDYLSGIGFRGENE